MKSASMILALCLCWAAPLSAATWYLDAVNGSDSTGDGSPAAPWASMAKVFTVVQPGDTVLLSPGNYGSVTFDQGHGLGTAAGRVTYMADPATTTPRPANWYEQEIPRPNPADPDGKAIFTSIKFDHYSLDKNATTKTGTPEGHYVTIDGVNVVGGNINIVSYVSHITIRNCNVFGNWSEYSSQISSHGFNLYRAYYWGSNYRHILIEDGYATRCRGGTMLLGNFHDVTVRGCHFHHHASSMISLQGNMEQVTIEGNHAHHQVAVADTLKHTQTVITPDAAEPNRIFTVSGDATYMDHVSVIDADTGTEDLRKVASFDHGTYRLALATPLSFNVEPGDTVKFWDDTHGSGVSVRNGDFTLRGNRIHDCGGTRGIYLYDPPTGGYANILMENNLFYSTNNQYTADLNHGLGANCRIVNNTFVGRKHSNYDTNGDADLLYGFALINATAASGADASTITVANNLMVGIGSAPAGAVVKNNIVYAGGGFEQDSVGSNANNLVYYNNEPVGSEPHPFDGSGAFFVGGPLFDALAFTTQHGENFNAAFQLVAEADAVGFADPALAPATDMTGAPRDAAPDVGCYESTAAPLIPGDANRDGKVDLYDFVALKQNFGLQSGARWDQGDFDGDGDVSLQDFVILKQNFGRSSTP